jgi:NAD(P)-dependent dehydrogenase (short-subunit alcohol dehydrogenase family)
MAGRLDGQVAVITGGASGIGAATVRRFVAEGARVVVADLQDDPGMALAVELGDAAIFAHTNVRDESTIAAAVDLAVSHFGRLDCMFANAGIVGTFGPIDELPIEEWDFTMSVNLRGVVLCMKHAARIMKPQGSGTILSTSSVAGLQGGLGPHAYTAAKSALIGLTRNIAAELIPLGIRVNCIAPGNMATEMIADLLFQDASKLEQIEQSLAAGSPMPGRAGLADDIARAAVYLASDDAGYVAGHTLVVDATFTARGTGGGGLFGQHAPMVRGPGKRGLPGEGEE